jgi:hypothetical protein
MATDWVKYEIWNDGKQISKKVLYSLDNLNIQGPYPSEVDFDNIISKCRTYGESVEKLQTVVFRENSVLCNGNPVSIEK